MIKKLTIAAILLPLGITAQAREGAYIGANLAWSQIDAEATSTVKESFKDSGFGGAFYAGYGRMGANGFLALEVNADISDAKVKEQAGGINFTYEKRESFGAGFLMGANLPHGLAAYARVGWQQSEFKGGMSYNQEKLSIRKDHDGIRYGVGLLIPLHETFDLRAEAARTEYNKKTYVSGFNIEPVTNEFLLGATIRF